MCNIEIINFVDIMVGKPLHDSVGHSCDTGQQRVHCQPDPIAGERSQRVSAVLEDKFNDGKKGQALPRRRPFIVERLMDIPSTPRL